MDYKREIRISARTLQFNSRLTDYPVTRELVIRYAALGVPSEMKNRCSGIDCMLRDYF